MSLTLILCCLWVLAGTITAFLPMKYQPWPGIPLLVAAPVLIVMLGREFGIWMVAAGLFAFVSMFRRPLFHYLGKLRNAL